MPDLPSHALLVLLETKDDDNNNNRTWQQRANSTSRAGALHLLPLPHIQMITGLYAQWKPKIDFLHTHSRFLSLPQWLLLLLLFPGTEMLFHWKVTCTIITLIRMATLTLSRSAGAPPGQPTRNNLSISRLSSRQSK